jgi:peptidoglycan hydrolase CwlO-like protein
VFLGSRSAGALVAAGLVALLAGAAPGPVKPAAAADCDHSLSSCQALLQAQDAAAANQAQLAGIDQQVAYSTGALAALAQVVSDLQRQVANQQAQVQATSARLEEVSRRVRFTQADLDRTQVRITVRQQLLDQRIRNLDKVGGVDYLELVLTSTTFTQLVDRVATIQRVVGGDQRLVDELKLGRQQVQRLRDQLQSDQANQRLLLSRQQQLLAQLAQQQQAQQAAYAAQQALSAQLADRRQQLEARQSSAQTQIEALQADYQRQLSALQGRGGAGGVFSVDTDLRIVPRVDAGALNAYFSGTSLAGLGPAFVSAGQRDGVNPLYLAAHAIEESAFGSSQFAQQKHNLFGIGAYDSNPDAALSFPSFQACIDYQAHFVARDYLSPSGAFYHGPTLRGMNVAYASDPSWARNIASIYLTLPGGLNRVG